MTMQGRRNPLVTPNGRKTLLKGVREMCYNISYDVGNKNKNSIYRREMRMKVDVRYADPFLDTMDTVNKYNKDEYKINETAMLQYDKAIAFIEQIKEKGYCTYEVSNKDIPYFVHHILIHWNYECEGLDLSEDIMIPTQEMQKFFALMNQDIIIQENGDWFVTTVIYEPINGK